MKWMIASDIHGSAYYCEQLCEAMEREKVEKLLLLGDILYHGPRNDLPKGYEPKKVIEMLNPRRQQILCVRGNCDAQVDQMVLDFPIMAEYASFYMGNRMVFATHGHIYNPANPPQMNAGDILLNGHTHIPAFEERENYIYVNPGSVSIPKDNTQHSYMIWEESRFIWKNLSGEVYLEKEL